MLNQNQFAQIPIQGQLDLKYNADTLSAIIDATSGGGLVPGQSVKMLDSAGGVPKVVECADDADDVFGFINYNIKNKTFEVGDPVELSFFRGNVMYMTSSAAIARNAEVAVVILGSKVKAAVATDRVVGRAIDKASGADELIRVIVDLPGVIKA